jgi:hypothetical protein
MKEFKEKWEVIEGTIDDFAKVKIGDRILELKSLGFSYLNVEKEKSISKLIASAPEMLEQLKTLYSFYEELAMKINSDDFDEEFRSKWNPIMSSTEQLIKKATE